MTRRGVLHGELARSIVVTFRPHWRAGGPASPPL